MRLTSLRQGSARRLVRLPDAMFNYFDERYLWNLAVLGTLNGGGLIDEVDRACAPIRAALERGQEVDQLEFYASWEAVADRLVESAHRHEANSQRISAAAEYYRAALYLTQAARLNTPEWFRTTDGYAQSIEVLVRHLELTDAAVSRVEIPFEGASLPGYLHLADSGGQGATPVVIQFNGVDSTKELMYLSGLSTQLAQRGVSTLMVDTPGTGEALRMRGLTANHESERWASACVDFLEGIANVDADAIGIVGWSLGGYFAPRAAAFDQRLKLVVAWDANHNWGEVQRDRRQRENGQVIAPHYWDLVCWAWGASDIDDLLERARPVTLDGIVELVHAPLLITHGAGNRQISVEYARRTFEQATGSVKRELRVFDGPEGGLETIGLDNLPVVVDYIADWVQLTFDEVAAATATLHPAVAS
jgi:esterase/lipase